MTALRNTPAPAIGDKWWRAEERYIDDGSETYCGVTIGFVEYEAVKLTPCGAWLRCITWPHLTRKKLKFALQSGSRAVRRTKVEALEGLIARKRRQIQIVAHQMDVARDAQIEAQAVLKAMRAQEGGGA